MNKLSKFLLSVILSTSLFTVQVSAEENSDNNAGGYTIEGVPNSNQIDTEVSYFYLHEDPNAEDSVKVKLTNSSDEEKTLTVKITNANTNVNGIIDYTGTVADHSSLEVPMTSIATASEEEVRVPKNSSVETEIKIKMPEQQMTGVVIGGITVSEKQEETDSGEGNALSNTYSYTLGLVVTNETEVDLYKNVSVSLESVGPKLFNGKKVVEANFLNSNPYIFAKATIKGEIIDKNSKKTVREEEKENVSIAPYSVYPFQFDWEKEELQPGDYIFKATVEADGREWSFNEEFKISSEEAKTINEESVYKVQIPKWLFNSLYLLIIISIGGSIYLLVRIGSRRKVDL